VGRIADRRGKSLRTFCKVSHCCTFTQHLIHVFVFVCLCVRVSCLMCFVYLWHVSMHVGIGCSSLSATSIKFSHFLSPCLLCNKHCSKISQETLLNSVSNDLRPLMIGQSRDSFTLLSVKDVMLFRHCQQDIHACAVHRVQIGCTLKQTCESHVTCFCVHE
jgi:hypothetical protein